MPATPDRGERIMGKYMRIFLPLAVVVVGVLIAVVMIKTKEEVETRKPDTPPPLVRVMPVTTETVNLSVRTQGTVRPRTESTLVPEVAGRVVSASERFVDGGFFEEGDVLLAIDPRDYRLAVTRAKARVAEARVRVEQEEEEAAVARREWESLGNGEATPLVLREPQLARVRADLEAAKADLEKARLDLERTRIRAPYAGRVREKMVDVGQYVAPGTPVARIYAVDYVEVRLPIPDADLAFVTLPLHYRGEEAEAAGAEGPEVVLRASFAGRSFEWPGSVVRTEGELDPQSRMVHAVAVVEDPYGRGDDPNRPPLAVGLFVEAEILGRTVEDVVVLPRTALRAGDRVLVVDGEDRLRFRDVRVLRTDRETAVIADGLAAGEVVCLSAVEAVVDGMKVRRVGS
jgi:RND family efflux transporter MFP subunit